MNDGFPDRFLYRSKKPPRRNRHVIIYIALFVGGILVLVYLTKGTSSETKKRKYDRERHDIPQIQLGRKIKQAVFPALPYKGPNSVDISRWPPNLAQNIGDPKIYIYKAPKSLMLSQSQLSTCQHASNNIETILYSLLLKPHKGTSQMSRYITENPEEADLFFIPLFPKCFLDACKSTSKTKMETCDVENDYVLPFFRWLSSQPTFTVSKLRRHLLVQSLGPFTNPYSEKTHKFLGITTYLTTYGSYHLSPSPFHSSFFRYGQDIIIPSTTPLLHAFFINPMDYLSDNGYPLVTLRGSAEKWRLDHAIPTRVEIWNPSPSWLGGSRWKKPNLQGVMKLADGERKRGTTVVWRGYRRNNEPENPDHRAIRRLLFPRNSTNDALSFEAEEEIHSGFTSLRGWDIQTFDHAYSHSTSPASKEDLKELHSYALSLSTAKFGLVLPLDEYEPVQVFWDYLAFGVVPVFLESGPSSGHLLPFVADFDYTQFTLTVPREKVHLLPEVLEVVSETDYLKLQENVWNVARLMVAEQGKGYVWKFILRELVRRGILNDRY